MSGAQLVNANLSGTQPVGSILSGTVFYIELVDGKQFPAIGLRQYYLDMAYSDPTNPPQLGGVVLDAETGEPLVWRGKSLESIRDNPGSSEGAPDAD